MTKIFIINGGQKFGHSGGKFNETIAKETLEFFKNNSNFEVKTTDINDDYDAAEEVDKFVWADVIVYHTPIWWFQLPHGFKKYIDVVFTEGHEKGIYHNDGRSSKNPAINYGTGGMLHGRKYLLTTSWNAPKEGAYTLSMIILPLFLRMPFCSALVSGRLRAKSKHISNSFRLPGTKVAETLRLSARAVARSM